MWSNGIFPKVEYESLGSSAEQIKAMYDMTKAPDRKDISLTPMVVSNHVSYLDGVVLGAVFGAPKIVAKAGAQKLPVLGKIMTEMEVVFVQRETSDSRKAAMDAISSHCTNHKPGQRPLLIFPEGTTTNGEGLKDFKKGAFNPGVPVRPVIIVYTGQWDASIPTYQETKQGVEKLTDAEWGAQFMGHFIHSLHVRVLAPYIPSEAEVANSDLYANNVKAFMEKELERVRKEITENSWQACAGRTTGGPGYKIGDVARIGVRRTRNTLSRLAQKFSSLSRQTSEEATPNANSSREATPQANSSGCDGSDGGADAKS